MLKHAQAQLIAIAEREVALKAQELRSAVVEGFSRPGTGRVYEDRFAMIGGKLRKVGKRIPHQASAPGEAPAIDTGRLVQSIVAIQLAPGRWRVGTNVDYAFWLEFGTRRMAPRPFLRPAVAAVLSK